MKFSTPFVALLAASSAYALSKRDDTNPEDMFNKLKSENPEAASQLEKLASEGAKNMPTNMPTNMPSNPLDTSTDNASTTQETPALGSMTQECQEIIKKYYACAASQNDYDKFCDQYNSEECKKLKETPLTSNEACKSATFEETGITQMFQIMDIKCARDNSGKYCPISENQKKNVGRSKNNQIDLEPEDFENSCRAESCRQTALYIAGMLKNATEALSQGLSNFGKLQKRKDVNLDDVIKHLNSDECLAMTKSGASTVKVTGAALASTLAVFLYYFF